MIDHEQIQLVVKQQAARYAKRNPSSSIEDLQQEAWLRILEKQAQGGVEHEGNAAWHARNACARQASFDQTAVSVPWQYRCRPDKNGAAALGQMAFLPKSLDEELFEDGGCLHDVIGSDGPSAELLVAEKIRTQEALAACTPSQRKMLDGLLSGLNSVEVAAAIGVSKQRVSEELKELRGRLRQERAAKRVKRKRRKELTREALVAAFGCHMRMPERRLYLALKAIGYGMSINDVQKWFAETELLVLLPGQGKAKRVYALAKPASHRRRLVCRVCGAQLKFVLRNKPNSRAATLCRDCLKKAQAQYDKQRYEKKKLEKGSK